MQEKQQNAERWESAMPEDARAAHDEVVPIESVQANSEDPGDLLPTVATVAIVGIGAAVFEAALLPGMVLGVAAMCAPRFFPQTGSALHPLFKSTMRGAYQIGRRPEKWLPRLRNRYRTSLPRSVLKRT
jgi:hypothetical protein